MIKTIALLVLLLFYSVSRGQVIDSGMEYSIGGGLTSSAGFSARVSAEYHLDICAFDLQYRIDDGYSVASLSAGAFLGCNSSMFKWKVTAGAYYHFYYDEFRAGGAVRLRVTDYGHWASLGNRYEICGGAGIEYNGETIFADFLVIYIRPKK